MSFFQRPAPSAKLKDLMQRTLTIIRGPDQGRSFSLVDGQTLTIGRGKASNTRIQDPRMSRVHCRVVVDGNSAVLYDSGSTGGTHVGSDPISEYVLKPGDVFRVGDTGIRYSTDQNHHTSLGNDTLFGRPKPKPKIKPLQDLLGETFGDFQLDSIVTMGNSGMVYRANDTRNGRQVAVKVLTPELAADVEQKERFVRAMKTMLPIRHPNIVPLYNAGQNGPYCWVAMEYIAGQDMNMLIDRADPDGMLKWTSAWRVGVHIGRALIEADEHGIIHRNVTPANILRRHADDVYLLGDLALAKALEGTLAKQLTQPGQLIGDVPFMSPERTRGNDSADHRSDLYGLGATLYALVTGRAPFVGESLPSLIQQVRESDPVAPRSLQPTVAVDFEEIVLNLIAKDPFARYQSASDMVVDLEELGSRHGLCAD